MKVAWLNVSITTGIPAGAHDHPAIDVEGHAVSWAAAGSSVTIQLVSVDHVHLGIGSVLSPPNDLVPVATIFNAKIILFDIRVPVTAGASVSHIQHETFRHLNSMDRWSCIIIREMFRLLSPSCSRGLTVHPEPSSRKVHGSCYIPTLLDYDRHLRNRSV